MNYVTLDAARTLVRAVLHRYHKTRMGGDPVEEFILRDPGVSILINELVHSVNSLRPSVYPPASESSESALQELRSKLAATARYITHDRECATVARHGGHLCSCGASAAARDAYEAQQGSRDQHRYNAAIAALRGWSWTPEQASELRLLLDSGEKSDTGA